MIIMRTIYTPSKLDDKDTITIAAETGSENIETRAVYATQFLANIYYHSNRCAMSHK